MDTNNKKLTRSRSDRMLAGVCGGLAAYFGLDPSLVRIGYSSTAQVTPETKLPTYTKDCTAKRILSSPTSYLWMKLMYYSSVPLTAIRRNS